MSHIIDYEEVKNVEFRNIICGAYSKDENKTLFCVTQDNKIHYEVWSNKKLIFVSDFLFDAVNNYNMQ